MWEKLPCTDPLPSSPARKIFHIAKWTKTDHSVLEVAFLASKTHSIFKEKFWFYLLLDFLFALSASSFFFFFYERTWVFCFVLKFPPNQATVATGDPLWRSRSGTEIERGKKGPFVVLSFAFRPKLVELVLVNHELNRRISSSISGCSQVVPFWSPGEKLFIIPTDFYCTALWVDFMVKAKQ